MTWLGLWSGARYDLGLSEAEFWRLTLRELMALFDRHAEAEHRADVRATAAVAELWALTANVWGGKKGKRYRGHDLYPFLKPEPKPGKGRSTEELRATIEAIKQWWPRKGEAA